MPKHIRKAIIISCIVILIIITVIASFFIIKYFKNRAKINTVTDYYSDENIQDRLKDNNTSDTNNLTLQIDGETVIGVIQIDKINFKGFIYNGTSLDTLSKGVGHFDNSPYLEGNVCLAAHNYRNYWGKLNTLDTGDTIAYTSFLGSKEYVVSSVNTIEETDFTLLEDSKDNRLTLITCILNNPTKRLCVQATEIK